MTFGFVSAATLGDDRYELNAAGTALVGRRKHKELRAERPAGRRGGQGRPVQAPDRLPAGLIRKSAAAFASGGF